MDVSGRSNNSKEGKKNKNKNNRNESFQNVSQENGSFEEYASTPGFGFQGFGSGSDKWGEFDKQWNEAA